MNLLDIQQCAYDYKMNFVEKFYIITTYNDTGFILIGEKTNFPHLIGIKKNIYTSNGYRHASRLYEDILNRNPINPRIIPQNIVQNSKIYNKAINFCNASSVFLDNRCPMIINYDSNKNGGKLNNVDKLIVDIDTGYMMGWVDHKTISINSEISLNKYCLSSWIDESDGTEAQKEKYIPLQDVDLIHTILVFDSSSNLIHQRQIKYQKAQKEKILLAISRNQANLLISKRNANNYIIIAKQNNIHCKINGIQY